jgi:hypothetical protein
MAMAQVLNRCPSAYEISTVHKREPPPKEILEDVSAKGGDLLTRTVENFLRPASREADRLRGDDDSEGSDEEGDTKKTPKEDKMDLDEPGSTGRVTRGKFMYAACQRRTTLSFSTSYHALQLP